MAKRKGLRRQLSSMTASGPSLEQQIQDLVRQKKYTTAIRKLQQGLKRNPDQSLTVSEADLWLLEGRHEFERAQYARAKSALQKALSFSLYDDTYYWLAKCLIAQKALPDALALFQTAFDDKTLPKDMGGCYLKLLFLNDKVDDVERLLKEQSKRFYAPQLHWARGVIALHTNGPKTALPHFNKMGRPASPADLPMLWGAYAQQQLGHWAEVERAFPSLRPAETKPSFFGGMMIRYPQNQPPAVQRLRMVQAAHSDRAPSDFVDLDELDSSASAPALILEMLHLIREANFHEAAHSLLDITDKMMAAYPLLKVLYRPLMLQAGTQALQEGEIGCTARFWEIALNKSEFDLNLALNLYQALSFTHGEAKAERLVNQIISWLKQTAQKSPQDWPKARLNPILAKLHCWAADCQMLQMHHSDVQRSVKTAEQLAPNHPDVVGRKGLNAFVKGKSQEAVPLLREALELGCRFPPVYERLVELETDPDTLKAIRRKFGKHFDDVDVDTEVDIPAWVEALTFQNYGVMEEFICGEKRATPTLKACQIFLDSADDEPSSGQKITLNQEKAVAQWETLLAAHAPAEQVEIIQAIYLIVQQHAKRNKKGMVALQRRYLKKLAELSSQQVPGADVAYLVISAIASPDTEKIRPVIEPILSRVTQPGNTLALTQLALRRFNPNTTFKPFIETWLKKDSQNPLLLLANATLYPRKSAQYETFHEKGFELARRLQDAEALQAFREEEWFAAQSLTRRVVGRDIGLFGDPSQLDMADMIKRMAREAFGADVPPEILAQMLPELMAQMGGFEEEDDDDIFDPFFLPPPPPPRRKKKRSKKRGFF